MNKHIKASGLKVDVVLVSPLTRALETAVGCFGNLTDSCTGEQPPLMVALTEQGGKRAAHPAVSAAGVAPFVCYEDCRYSHVRW